MHEGVSAVGDAVRHRTGGPGNIDDRCDSFELMVSGPVQEVAGADHSASFKGKVQREAGTAGAKHPRHRIELASPGLQVRTGNVKVARAQSRRRRKQKTILRVPVTVRLDLCLGRADEGCRGGSNRFDSCVRGSGRAK